MKKESLQDQLDDLHKAWNNFLAALWKERKAMLVYVGLIYYMFLFGAMVEHFQPQLISWLWR